MADNYITSKDEKGNVSISEDVIAVMVAAALAEVEGVAGLSNTVGSELADFLGKKSISKGIKISFEDDERVIIDVLIMVRFGSNITNVAHKVQQEVASAVESMTGLKVVVNVHVSGVAFEKQ
jgi:uncharacterized alkaline shock family protein YloU